MSTLSSLAQSAASPTSSDVRRAPAARKAQPTSAKSSRARSQAKQTKPVEPPAPLEPALSEHLVVRDLFVEGQRKLEKDAILSHLKSKKGEEYSADDVREDVLALFHLGYFNDIVVSRKVDGKNVDLTYRVTEKPSMQEINFEGNSELKSEELLETTGLKPYQILNESKVHEAVEKIQKMYEDKGYFLAKIDARIDDVKKDETVRVVFTIRESDKVKVKKIIFVGNHKITDEYLHGHMFTQEEGYFSFLSGSGGYKQEAFERDTMALRYAYYNQGYIKAVVDRPQVSVTPDKTGIYLTIRIEENNQYNVGEVDFSGDLLFSKPELFQSIKIDKNVVFAYDVLQKDLSELQAKYGDLGYAYANIIPRWQFNEPEKKVNLVFEIDKGHKVYFGHIDVVGNSKTRDKVLRRELKIREGELYNETRRRQSVEAVQRLGFFDEVNFKSSTPANSLDVMNLEIVMKERNTGQVQVSAGYGSSTGVTFGGSVQQTNFLGRGQNLGVSVNIAGDYQVYDLSFTDPYFRDSLWSLGSRAFQSQNNARLDYGEKRAGAELMLGHPIAENLRLYLKYGYTTIDLQPIYTSNSDGTTTLLTDYSLFPLRVASGDEGTVTGTMEYDTRNDRMRPTKGIYGSLSASNSGIAGGNLKYNRGTANLKFFKNVFWDVVWRNSVTLGQVSSSGSGPVPFNDLFLLGGPYSLRGYRYGTVGRMRLSQTMLTRLLNPPAPQVPPTVKDATDQAMRFYGGEQEFQYQGELQFPLIREADMFGVFFFDVGEAENVLSDQNTYADWGIGVRWFSPIGPLRFEWGFPINRNPLYHEPSIFEFSIGTPF